MRTVIVFALAVAAVAASPDFQDDPYPNPQRIVGGSVTDINSYPSMAAMLFSPGTTGHIQSCGGTILNNRSILTAAHCTIGHPAYRWQSRLGSTNANSGGSVFTTSQIINNPNYNFGGLYNNDISIIRVTSAISFTTVIQPATIAGPYYNPHDNEVVWAAGWGRISENGTVSEQLRHVEILTVNQASCINNYAAENRRVTENMLCAGWSGVGGRAQCQGDSGGPLYHNNVVIGVYSWGVGCARPNLPGVNVRVSRFTAWIQANA